MSEVINIAYRNQNSLRSYPFADGSTMADTSGVALPTDFLIDAFIYPRDLQGVIFISSIDITASRIHLKDSVTNKECGFADFTIDSDSVYVYDNELYMRQIGVLVFGAGLPAVFQGTAIRNFTAAAMSFCPTAFIPMNQVGVRAIQLPDGTIMTGDVVIEGQDGIVITTATDDGVDIVNVDIVGNPSTDEQSDCGDCNIVTTICFERVPCSAFTVSEYTPGVVGISAYNFNLEDICSKQRLSKLPDSEGNLPRYPRGTVKPDDPCGPDGPTPVNPPCGEAESFRITLADVNGNIAITTPSDAAFNPVYVLALPGRGSQGQTKMSPVAVHSDTESKNILDLFNHPATFTDAIEIGIKGLSQFRRGPR